ncbi:hypothetical protein BAE44_0014903, partial [Dichanthelium oligosanthes]
LDRSPYGSLFRQTRDLLRFEFTKHVISVCSRTCKQGSDSLAAHGAGMNTAGLNVFMDQAPVYASPQRGTVQSQRDSRATNQLLCLQTAKQQVFAWRSLATESMAHWCGAGWGRARNQSRS